MIPLILPLLSTFISSENRNRRNNNGPSAFCSSGFVQDNIKEKINPFIKPIKK
jgi:hypothetical protein